MTVETDADLAAMFDRDAFGEDVTFTPAGGAPLAVVGIWTAAHRVAAAGGDFPGVSTVAPVLTLPAGALPGEAAQGDAVARGGATYRVRDVQPDGTGLVRLVLEKES